MKIITKSINNYKINIKFCIKLVLGIFLFRIALDFVYSEHVSTIFRYTGFISEFDFSRYVLSWFILILFIPLIISLHKKIYFSSMIVILLFYLTLIPYTTMIAFYPFSMGYIVNNTFYWAMLFLFYKLVPEIRFNRLNSDKLVGLMIFGIIGIFSATILYISWRYTGFRVTLNIFDVYDLRSEVRTFRLPTIVSYIYAASKAVNPILLVYFMSIKKYKMSLAIFLIQILSFSINGSKTVLFSIFLAAFLYWYYSDKYISKIPWLLFLITTLSSFEILLKDTFFLVAFVIRRVFFVPNLLGYNYYDFFSVNTPDYFRQSFLRNFGFQSPYIAIDNMIGSIYYNKPDMAANNGLISDAYTNLGWIGLIVMPMLLILILKVLDACAEGLDKRIFVITAVTMTFILISSFLSTALLTHGLLAVCLILYLLPRKEVS